MNFKLELNNNALMEMNGTCGRNVKNYGVIFNNMSYEAPKFSLLISISKYEPLLLQIYSCKYEAFIMHHDKTICIKNSTDLAPSGGIFLLALSCEKKYKFI
ncbi:hypothetical protein ACJX0J_028454, partial [Zea mays]